MKRIYLFLIVASFIAVIVNRCGNNVEAVPVSSPDDHVQYAQDSFPFCNTINDSVQWMIQEAEIEHPDIVYAQAILETGHFKSKVFNENNNLFGMKLPVHARHLPRERI